MSDLKVLKWAFTILGILGILVGLWMHFAGPLFYRVHAVEVVRAEPGAAKITFERTVLVAADAKCHNELHCLIDGMDTVYAIDSAHGCPLESGWHLFAITLPLPTQAFNGADSAICYIVGAVAFSPLGELLPPVSILWQTPTFLAEPGR